MASPTGSEGQVEDLNSVHGQSWWFDPLRGYAGRRASTIRVVFQFKSVIILGQPSSASEWRGSVMRASLATSLHYLLRVWQLKRCLLFFFCGGGSDFWLGCHWRLICKSDPFVMHFFSTSNRMVSRKKGCLLLHFRKQIIFVKLFLFINAPVQFPPHHKVLAPWSRLSLMMLQASSLFHWPVLFCSLKNMITPPSVCC